jgi:hypothetical protein
MQLEIPTDIRENIAYFKKWKDATKAQAMRPFSEYPKMPLVPARDKAGKLTGKAPVPIFDTFKQPIVFATARDEAEWLADHPEEASEIAEIEAGRAPATDKLEASNQALQAVTDRLKGAKAEIDEKDAALAEALAQLETAKLQLAAKRRADDPDKLDMRTRAGREAAAAQKAAAEG